MAIRNLDNAPVRARKTFWNIGSVDQTKFDKGPELLNNESLTGLNAAGTLEVELIKVNALDTPQVTGDLKVTGNLVVVGTSTTGSDISAGTVGAALLFTTNTKLEFRAAAQYINSPAVGKLAMVATVAGADDIQLTGGVNVTGTLAVSGAVALASTLAMADNITMATNKKVLLRDTTTFIQSPSAGKMAITATAAGADDITITGSVTLTGALAVSSTLAVTGASTLTGAIALNGNATVATAKTLTVTDAGALIVTSPKVTTSIADANGNISIALSATATAVNGIGVTNAATGNGTTNPVTLAPSGTDTHVGLTIAPKGASGVLTLGLSTGTADIVLGSSSGTQSVKVANGAGIVTVNIGNVSIAGVTVAIAGAATATGVTDTVNIATGNTAGTGSKVVHIADGTPAGTNIVTIGSNANTANTTTLQGGNGAGAITLTPQTTGTIVIGAAAGTGNITLGSSSGTQTVLIGNGAGASLVNIANATVAGATVSIAGGVPASGLTDEIDLALGNAASTAKKIVKIATGTPVTSGNNQVTIGGGATSAVTVNAVARSYQQVNYIATETGANNALVAALLDAAGNSVTVAAGLAIAIKLGHTLQAGANTLNLNSHGTDSIKKASAPGTDVAVVAASGSILHMIFDGTVWQVVGQ